jgi:hypothetical protein
MALDPTQIQIIEVPVNVEPVVIEVLVDESTIVEVITEGPPGTPGLPGNIAAAHVHTQAVAAEEWIVNHNIGANPLTQILTVGGQEMLADIIHMNNNQLRVYFTTPQTGSVRCL